MFAWRPWRRWVQQERSLCPRPQAGTPRSAAEVSFTAAVGLWKMNDKSGENILDAVLAGDRKANRGLVSSEKHQADQDLHSPSKLAEIGAEQGAYALLGPFGFGLSALRSRNGANGIHPRVIAATLLGEDTSTASMKRFLDALDDRDPFVRAAAARLLGRYHNQEALDGLSGAMYDAKPEGAIHGRCRVHTRGPSSTGEQRSHANKENSELKPPTLNHLGGGHPIASAISPAPAAQSW